MTPQNTYHTVVVGSGCAGYHAAERLWMLGVRDICILTDGITHGTSRNTGSDKQTYYKLSLCGGEGDSVREMAHTLYDGGAVMGETAMIEAAYSTRCFLHLVELGVPFPTNEYGEYAGYKTDHDPRSRATSCGPLTSKYMTEALQQSVSEKGIPVFDGYTVTRLLTKDSVLRGLTAVETATGKLHTLSCRNVILCTGGSPCIYEHTVYPDSQCGAFGLAIDAGAALVNMDQWQYGIASVGFKWNLSGSYQQVLPRYISVDAEGTEREFLYDALGEASLGSVFLKGYQWPFDVRRADGSSRVDLLVAAEIAKGRRVYLDFTANPKGLDTAFSVLCDEAYDYLRLADCLFGTPIERLERLNAKAIHLYASHGIDLWQEPLEIAVCAQHINGGIAVDSHWQSTVRGLYAAGECAGTFGVYRPGGSALNATQVGSLRAAEHIAAERDNDSPPPALPSLPHQDRAEPNTAQLDEGWLSRTSAYFRQGMSLYAAFHRDRTAMENVYREVCEALTHPSLASPDPVKGRDPLMPFHVRNQLLTTRAVLSAMICSADAVGSHGSALLRNDTRPICQEIRRTRTVTHGDRSSLSPVSPLPDGELRFEALLSRVSPCRLDRKEIHG